MAEPLIRVILVEDHAIVLNGLEKLLSQDGRFEVVACCRSGGEGLEAVRRGGADIMLLDLRMPGMSGLEVLTSMNQERRSCRVVLLTAAINDAEVLSALDLKVGGLVLKESSPDELMECLVKVHGGAQWIDRQVLTRAIDLARRQDAGRGSVKVALTPRELEIVKLVAEGHRNKGIADRLSITEGTVKIHLHNVYEKVGVDGRLELLLWVKDQGLA